jgi:type VI secretion system protein
MVESRLLERMLHSVNPKLNAGLTNDGLLRLSIVQHLTRLLNTRLGSVPIDPDYGLSDMNNIAGSFTIGSSEQICEEIILQIKRYEPRLKNPTLTTTKEDNQIITLKFELSAQINHGHTNLSSDPFAMYLRINSAGQIKIEARRDR